MNKSLAENDGREVLAKALTSYYATLDVEKPDCPSVSSMCLCVSLILMNSPPRPTIRQTPNRCHWTGEDIGARWLSGWQFGERSSPGEMECGVATD